MLRDCQIVGLPIEPFVPLFTLTDDQLREHAVPAVTGAGELPAMVRARPQSVRAYDEEGMMVHAEVVEGDRLDARIRKILADGNVAYLHLHNARPGCFNCAVVRA